MAAAAARSGARRQPVSALAVALYLTALALLGQGFMDALAVGGVAAPFGSLRWRFGFLGVVFLHLPFPLLGAALASVTAALLRHRFMLLTLTALQGVLGVAGLAALVLFALDATQLAGSVPKSLRSGYISTVIETALLGSLGVALFLALGLASRLAFRREPAPLPRSARDNSPLVGRG